MQGPYRILVVDDDPKVLFMLRESLEKLGNGYGIATAADGQQALVKAQNQPFDLIISDVKMPGIDGIQLVEMIRSLNIETMLIWITALGCESLKAECERLSVSSCLQKPLRISEIRDAVQAALSSKDENRQGHGNERRSEND
ncbi:MAG TPA: response regulator [Anaerolineales bacterium]|nr:response regulator [Anaerolineales bacterium]